MAHLAPVSVRISPQERELLEVAAEQARTNLSDFIRRKAVEAAEIQLVHQNVVVISAGQWEQLESWADRPAKAIPALRKLARSKPAWRT